MEQSAGVGQFWTPIMAVGGSLLHADSQNFWHVKIDPKPSNGLAKTSAVDVLQARGVDTGRFIKKLGRLDATQMEDIAAAMAALVEHT